MNSFKELAHDLRIDNFDNIESYFAKKVEVNFLNKSKGFVSSGEIQGLLLKVIQGNGIFFLRMWHSEVTCGGSKCHYSSTLMQDNSGKIISSRFDVVAVYKAGKIAQFSITEG